MEILEAVLIFKTLMASRNSSPLKIQFLAPSVGTVRLTLFLLRSKICYGFIRQAWRYLNNSDMVAVKRPSMLAFYYENKSTISQSCR